VEFDWGGGGEGMFGCYFYAGETENGKFAINLGDMTGASEGLRDKETVYGGSVSTPAFIEHIELTKQFPPRGVKQDLSAAFASYSVS
jgi:hypothetical protein